MMQFDWTTFILEILNFLVLIWILQRLFYRPLLAKLDARQQKISDEIAHAELLNKQGEELRQQYELRLQEWERERENLRSNAAAELAQLRSVALENLKQTLADEEAKLQVRNQVLKTAQEKSLRQNAAEVSHTLARLASPQLTHSIAAMVLEDLGTLSPAEQAALHKAVEHPVAGTDFEIISAHSLDNNMRLALSQGLSLASGQTLEFVFKEQPELLAGLRVVVGECQLDANLGAELVFFSHQLNHD